MTFAEKVFEELYETYLIPYITNAIDFTLRKVLDEIDKMSEWKLVGKDWIDKDELKSRLTKEEVTK